MEQQLEELAKDKRLRSTFFPTTLKYAFYVSSYPSWAMGVLSGLSDLTLVPQIFWPYHLVREELNGHIWFTPKLTRQTHLPVGFVNSFLVSNPFLLMFVVQLKYRLGDTLWYSWMGEGVSEGCQRLSKVVMLNFHQKGRRTVAELLPNILFSSQFFLNQVTE